MTPRAAALAAIVALVLAACGARTGLDLAEDAAPPGPPPAPETCNALDDDSDGRVDEDIPRIPCRTGECAFDIAGCIDGFVPVCPMRRPEPERCNLEDDDCDGRADEGLGFGPLGPPIVVRGDEGSTGGCTSCRWAGGATIAILDERMVVTWRLGFDGSFPEPNAFGRVHDRRGAPLGPPVVLFDTNIPNGIRSARSSADRAVLGFCGRRGGNDLLMGAWIDDDARTVVAPRVRDASARSCGASHPDVHVAGGLHFFAHTDNGGGGGAIVVDVAAADGTSLASHVLRDHGGDLRSPPRLATRDGRTLVVAGFRADDAPRISRLLAVALDDGGAPLARLEIPPPADRAESWFCETALAAVRDGFVAVAAECAGSAGEPSGRLVVRFDARGNLVEPAVRLEPERRYHEIELASRPGGDLVMAALADEGLLVAVLDAEGRLQTEWRSDPPEGLGLSGMDIETSGTSAWLTYPAAPAIDAMPNPVLLRELGCLSP